MSYHLDDTICAIATAPGGAARGMVRLSGADAIAIASHIFQSSRPPQLARLRQPARLEGGSSITLDNSAHLIPCSLFVWPTSRSYTREPVVELHTVGSQPILEAVVAALCRVGVRVAEPGEFTMRAFLAGRIDLTQAEAVLGVIDARAGDELHAALSQLAGGLAGPLQRLRDELLQLLAELEAGLDFVDEDIEFISSGELAERIGLAIAQLDEAGQQMASRHTVVGIPQIVLAGAPNAGKSSLFNALVDRYGVQRSENPKQAALVSPIDGTTRDYLTAIVSFDGMQFELVDTAGIEHVDCIGRVCSPSQDKSMANPTIDAQAQSLAAEQSSRADLRAYCVDASSLRSAAGSLARKLRADSSKYDVVVLTKSDLVPRSAQSSLQSSVGSQVVVTSSRSGEGLTELSRTLRDTARDSSGACVKGVQSTAERCQESIRLASAALTSAKTIIAADGGTELVAEELRSALDELGKVVGAVYTDDLLDRIFSTFCIGK